MKNITLAVISSLIISSPMVIAATGGTITFNGKLTATTCKIDIEGQGADALVKLPTIGVNQLSALGETAGSTSFNMALSGCSGTLSSASAFFEAGGGNVDVATGRLNNSGSAQLVQLQLRDGSSSKNAIIKAGSQEQAMSMTYVDTSSGTATLPYLVEYYAQGKTTPGDVVSKVVYSIQYK
ncbi:fimbrial protein [Enterobacillus tribolii]|uniref:Major type 1 subunit fimbrin (Pilin) n=1 Tax=Enterobacillus tribolii TaxID=1487935 RepID=A0A370Q6C3_9GAMM|nr:fimbrial protein [Enterobacillus tribolii]MBW7984952.1 type 1 fimbrial protein [Enterobacillus tribolii]RDK83908.1 major type 1 subunit fimbrin (pilin) [Enterobacillus tribolii]